MLKTMYELQFSIVLADPALETLELHTSLDDGSSTYIDPSTLFHCDNNERISILAKCNGIPECADMSDEFNCTDVHKGNY